MDRLSGQRHVGLDVVRGVAIVGVALINYHGYLMLRGGPGGPSPTVSRVFNPFNGPLATRFAATFVIVAGVGLTLLGARPGVRQRLLKRGLSLFIAGVWFDVLWPGTILFYLGAMFMIGAVLYSLTDRWLAAIIVVCSTLGPAIVRLGPSWMFDSYPQELKTMVLHALVNGTHPLLPWLAFLCIGMLIGRRLPWTLVTKVNFITFGCILVGVGYLLSLVGQGAGETMAQFMRTDPYSRSPVYVVTTVGSSLAAIGVISTLAERRADARSTQWLATAGRMTLTLYVAHALVFKLMVDWLGWVRPTGLDTAALLTLAFWIGGVLTANLWLKRFPFGPLEWTYRQLGG